MKRIAKTIELSPSFDILQLPAANDLKLGKLNQNKVRLHFTLPNYKSMLDRKKASTWTTKSNNRILTKGTKNSIDKDAVLIATDKMTIINPWPCLIDETKVAYELDNDDKDVEMEIILIEQGADIEICGLVFSNVRESESQIDIEEFIEDENNWIDNKEKLSSQGSLMQMSSTTFQSLSEYHPKRTLSQKQQRSKETIRSNEEPLTNSNKQDTNIDLDKRTELIKVTSKREKAALVEKTEAKLKKSEDLNEDKKNISESDLIVESGRRELSDASFVEGKGTKSRSGSDVITVDERRELSGASFVESKGAKSTSGSDVITVGERRELSGANLIEGKGAKSRSGSDAIVGSEVKESRNEGLVKDRDMKGRSGSDVITVGERRELSGANLIEGKGTKSRSGSDAIVGSEVKESRNEGLVKDRDMKGRSGSDVITVDERKDLSGANFVEGKGAKSRSGSDVIVGSEVDRPSDVNVNEGRDANSKEESSEIERSEIKRTMRSSFIETIKTKNQNESTIIESNERKQPSSLIEDKELKSKNNSNIVEDKQLKSASRLGLTPSIKFSQQDTNSIQLNETKPTEETQIKTENLNISSYDADHYLQANENINKSENLTNRISDINHDNLVQKENTEPSQDHSKSNNISEFNKSDQEDKLPEETIKDISKLDKIENDQKSEVLTSEEKLDSQTKDKRFEEPSQWQQLDKQNVQNRKILPKDSLKATLKIIKRILEILMFPLKSTLRNNKGTKSQCIISICKEVKIFKIKISKIDKLIKMFGRFKIKSAPMESFRYYQNATKKNIMDKRRIGEQTLGGVLKQPFDIIGNTKIKSLKKEFPKLPVRKKRKKPIKDRVFLKANVGAQEIHSSVRSASICRQL